MCKNIIERTGHRWQYNMVHVLCMLDNWGYRHTLRIYNTFAFPGQNGYTKVPECYVRMYIAVFLTLEAYSYSGISPFFKQMY